MFILVDDGVLNIKRVTTIEIDRDTTSEINYLFNDGAIIKEKFDNEIEALAKFEVLTEENLFIKTNDNRLINAMYIKNIEKDLLNSKRLVYVLYNGAPVKETYLNESEVDSALNTLKIELESIGDKNEDEVAVDLTPYLKKVEANTTYATQTALTEGLATKADSTAIPDITGLATKTEVETKANINAIPTKTSQLTNDSDFTTGADLQSLGAEFGSQIQAMGTQNAQSFSNLEAKIPTKTSQLTNDSDFITSTVVGEAFQSFAEDIGKSFVTLDVFNAKIEEIQALIDGHHPQV